MSNQPSRLGKGLDSLIPTEIENIDDFASKNMPEDVRVDAKSVQQLDIDAVDANPYQPRTDFEQSELDELATSIKAHGILQPLIVVSENDWRFQLIAGERRLRAAKQVGLKTVPAIVRTLSQQQQLEVALIENVQRSDLAPLEEAVAYSKLVDQFNMNNVQIAKSVGKAPSTITNIIRLLKLSEAGKRALSEGKITEGHARQLLALEDHSKQDELLEYILKHNPSVRELENLVREFKKGVEIKKEKVVEARSTQTHITKDLGSYLGTKVSLHRLARGGRLQIEYYSDEELGRIYQQILGKEPEL